MDSLSGKSRPGADSRSARDSTTLPTAGHFAAPDDDPPSAPGVLAPARHPGGRSAHRGDPAHSGAERRSQPAWRPSGGWHAAPRATEQSMPHKPHHDYESRRYAPTPAKPSTHNDQGDDRSPAPQHPAHQKWRSLPARETTDNAPTPDPNRSAASHQPGGTISIQPPATHQPRQPRPRSKHHQRPLPKTGPDPHAALSTADQATTTGHAPHEPPPDAPQHSPQTSFITKCCDHQLNPPWLPASE